MILLDTNVVSEPIKPVPNPRVLAWLDLQSIDTLHLPAPGLGELLQGIELLPWGNRRTAIQKTLDRMIETLIQGRVLAFDREAAERYARLTIYAQKRGVQISAVDGQIGAIAKAKGFIVATRDVEPFIAMGVSVINPWDDDAKERHQSIAEALAMEGDDDIELDTPPRT